MKPLSSCALFGAVRALSGIRDALILQHSVVGCQWGSLAFRYAGKPYNVRQASSVIYNEDVVNGGEKVLRKALQEAEQFFPQCGAVFVVSGCVPNMIGDDVEGVLADCESRQRLLSVKAPGYAGSIDSGVEAAYLSLLPLLQEPEQRLPASINILGVMNDDCYADNDLVELKKFLGSKVTVNCTLQDCSLAELAALPQAALNVCFGYGEALAKKMQERFGVPYIKCAYPYGAAGLQGFLRQLEQALAVDFTAELAEDTASFTLDEMEQAVSEKKPVLLCGSSFLRALAEERQLPLLRFVYPLFDQICLTENTLLGARGAAFIIEQLVNGALQQNYKPDGLYSGLREGICEVRHA